jgi:hypothetical protein
MLGHRHERAPRERVVAERAEAPIAKQKIRLSKSNPVRCARPNRLGGFQYSGTKIGSVRPRRLVARLTRSIRARKAGVSA